MHRGSTFIGIDLAVGRKHTGIARLRDEGGTIAIEKQRTATLDPPPCTGPEWRREALFRATDHEVKRRVGKTPLSVPADKIGCWATR